jgi:hypothetical protein
MRVTSPLTLGITTPPGVVALPAGDWSASAGRQGFLCVVFHPEHALAAKPYGFAANPIKP